MVLYFKLAVSQKGSEYAKFSIEVPKNREGLYNEKMNVTVFGKIVEDVKKLEGLEKPIIEIEGSLESRLYKDKIYYNIVVSDFFGSFNLLEKKSNYKTNKEISEQKKEEQGNKNNSFEDIVFDI